MGVLEAMVRQWLGSGAGDLGRVRGLVGQLANGLENGSPGAHVGSPKLIQAQQETAVSLRYGVFFFEDLSSLCCL